jgi:hypothetical protein
MHTDQRMLCGVWRDVYEPAVRTDWLDGHDFLDGSREGLGNDATKPAGGVVRVHSATHIRSNLCSETDDD